MPLLQLTLENLAVLGGGKAVAAFERHLKRAAEDCSDRPGDKTARTVTLTVKLKPVAEPDGDCCEVVAQVLAKSSVPVHTTKAYSLGLRRGGMLVFNPDSDDNVNQSTMPFDGDEG